MGKHHLIQSIAVACVLCLCFFLNQTANFGCSIQNLNQGGLENQFLKANYYLSGDSQGYQDQHDYFQQDYLKQDLLQDYFHYLITVTGAGCC